MRIRIFFSTLLLLLVSGITVFAQPGEPCNGNDPDAYCPLDSWVIFLAAVAVIFAVFHLYRKQKSLLHHTKGIK